jgi:hypothetical protein
MHPTHSRVVRLAADRRQDIVMVIAAALPRLNQSAETGLAYGAVCALWGLVIYLIVMAIGS